MKTSYNSNRVNDCISKMMWRW